MPKVIFGFSKERIAFIFNFQITSHLKDQYNYGLKPYFITYLFEQKLINVTLVSADREYSCIDYCFNLYFNFCDFGLEVLFCKDCHYSTKHTGCFFLSLLIFAHYERRHVSSAFRLIEAYANTFWFKSKL
jgi:hypothetical protein